jgi:hypothetical protein
MGEKAKSHLTNPRKEQARARKEEDLAEEATASIASSTAAEKPNRPTKGSRG